MESNYPDLLCNTTEEEEATFPFVLTAVNAALDEKFILLMYEKIGFWCKLSRLCEVAVAKGKQQVELECSNQISDKQCRWLAFFCEGLKKTSQPSKKKKNVCRYWPILKSALSVWNQK